MGSPKSQSMKTEGPKTENGTESGAERGGASYKGFPLFWALRMMSSAIDSDTILGLGLDQLAFALSVRPCQFIGSHNLFISALWGD